MMMGPTKKKVVSAAVIAFTIPVVIGGVLFWSYSSKIKAEMEQLELEGRTEKRYVLNKSLAEGDIITPEDLSILEVKLGSSPVDSYVGDLEGSTTSLSKIVNRRLMIDAEAKTIVTNSMLFAEGDDEPAIDERLQEFNMLTLPSDVNVGDYVDIRITFPNGEDYLVVSGKEVKSLGSTSDSNTVFLQLDEEEIIRTTAAIIESFMTNGSEIYANKYVKPNTQLYDSARVDYVAKYQEAVQALIKEREEIASGDLEEYKRIYAVENVTMSGEKILVTEADITLDEIAFKTGIDADIIKNIQAALEANDESILEIYKRWLVKTELSMENNYPVKSNIAQLVLSNPNILKDIESKYNIVELEIQRANIIDIPLYVIDEYTGTITEAESISRIEQELTKKIETQKLERKEYLQALILEQNSSSSNSN